MAAFEFSVGGKRVSVERPTLTVDPASAVVTVSALEGDLPPAPFFPEQVTPLPQLSARQNRVALAAPLTPVA